MYVSAQIIFINNINLRLFYCVVLICLWPAASHFYRSFHQLELNFIRTKLGPDQTQDLGHKLYKLTMLSCRPAGREGFSLVWATPRQTWCVCPVSSPHWWPGSALAQKIYGRKNGEPWVVSGSARSLPSGRSTWCVPSSSSGSTSPSCCSASDPVWQQEDILQGLELPGPRGCHWGRSHRTETTISISSLGNYSKHPCPDPAKSQAPNDKIFGRNITLFFPH